MIGKLGEDKKVALMCKKHLKKAFKNKYFKLGYKSAAKGKSRHENPYKLSGKILELLKKRTYWDLGYEQKAYSKPVKHKSKKSKHK